MTNKALVGGVVLAIALTAVRHSLAGNKRLRIERVVPATPAALRQFCPEWGSAPAGEDAVPSRAAKSARGRAAKRLGARAGAYKDSLVDLHETLGRQYPCFALKGIDWDAVGRDLLPRVQRVRNDTQFGLLCMELVARLEDSHANLRSGTAKPPMPPVRRWDPGVACLLDDRGRPVVYHVAPRSPAARAGVKVGMTVLSVNGRAAADAIEDCMKRIRKYQGYSSDRYLRYDAARFFVRQKTKGARMRLAVELPGGGRRRTFRLPATLGIRYLPRLPVPIAGIRDSGKVSWKMLPGRIGYIYVRRIREDLIPSLDRAVGRLAGARGLIVDVRGNSGGGFDGRRAHRNFAPDDPAEPKRPRFTGSMALLIDARCISAGEGWGSWFIAKKRARAFGTATAGASARKQIHTLKNGLYRVRFPVKAYRGYLDRLIERRGLEPDVPLRQTAADLAAGRDTVLQAARKYLLNAKGTTRGAPSGAQKGTTGDAPLWNAWERQ